MELEDILCDFSLKPFVGPTTTPQRYYEMAYSAVTVLRGGVSRPVTDQNERTGARLLSSICCMGSYDVPLLYYDIAARSTLRGGHTTPL